MTGHFGKEKGVWLPLPEAWRIVQSRLPAPRIAPVPLSEAAGGVLATEVASDVDMPPFDRAAMDGYAVRACDTRGAPVTLAITGEEAAGSLPVRPVGKTEAHKIMTGAALPEGADAVQMVERTRALGDGRVEILEAVKSGENVARRGEDLKVGQRVLPLGAYLSAAEIGLLASVGKVDVPVFGAPRVAVLSTGNELVGAASRPGPSQIRNSNGPTLAALARAAGCPVTDLGIARDDRGDLMERLRQGLAHDCLLSSGGVSMGEHDLVDAALRDLGVQIHFDAVAIKPGKPTVFGTHRESGALVFGLPGNPLSCLVAFTLLVAPAMRALRRIPKVEPTLLRATILGAVKGDRRRRCYVRGTLRMEERGFVCEAVSSHGSADLPSFARGNALIEVPEGRTRIESGEMAMVLYDETFLYR